MKLTGNTILITGGGSGIGRGLAVAFHESGNQVIITGRTQSKLDETIAAYPGLKSYTVDMTDAQSITQLADSVAKDFPAVNVLINNAGIMHNENLHQTIQDIAEQIIATNLIGPMRLVGELVATLQKNPDAVIMNVSSGLAFVPLAMTPTYSATKAAIHSYTQSLRYQLKDTPIEILELVPPYVATSLMGDRQIKDPNAMPLADFIAETMEILASDPTPKEICVKRVAPLRQAADQGPEAYEQTFIGMNNTISAARHAEISSAVL